MKRIGVMTMVCAAFAAGMIYVYSCGGGSESDAQDLTIIESKIDALALYIENMDAKIDSLTLYAQSIESKVDTMDTVVDGNNVLNTGMNVKLDNIINTLNSMDGVVDSICNAIPGC